MTFWQLVHENRKILRIASRNSGIRREFEEWIWLCGRVLRKCTLSALPIPLHFKVADYRGRPWAFGEPSEHVRQNLSRVFGETLNSSEVERIAWQHHRYTQGYYLERILPNLPGFDDPRRWPVAGLQHLDDAAINGRGVILVTAHYGYPLLIPRILGVYGYRVRQVVAELGRLRKQRNLKDWLTKASRLKKYTFHRTRIYTEVLGTDDFVASLDVRPILSALSKNEILLIAGEGLRATEFKRFALLGREYPFPTGFIKIAILTKAVVLPAFSVPDEDNSTIRTEIGEPLTIDPKAGIEENLSQFVAILNEKLQTYPQFWQRWGLPNHFEEVLRWADDDQKDPFTSKHHQSREKPNKHHWKHQFRHL